MFGLRFVLAVVEVLIDGLSKRLRLNDSVGLNVVVVDDDRGGGFVVGVFGLPLPMASEIIWKIEIFENPFRELSGKNFTFCNF